MDQLLVATINYEALLKNNVRKIKYKMEVTFVQQMYSIQEYIY